MSARHRLTGLTRRAGSWAFNIAMVLVVLGCVAWVVPSAFGFSRYVITGGSMEPTIHRGAVVFEKPVAVDDLDVGDVITYQPPADSGVTSLVTHRIVAIEPAEGGGVLFSTQGDSNPRPDPWKFQLLDPEQPVVQASVPHVGWVFIALADRTTRLVLIGGPAGLIALYSLVQVLGALRPRPAAPAAPVVPVVDSEETDTRAPALV